MSQGKHGSEDPGHLALVTGAASGIGAAIARRLHAAGRRVLAVDRSEENLARLSKACGGERLIPVVCDLAVTEDLSRRVKELLNVHGPVRQLVNNAGVWPGGSLTTLSDEKWMLNLSVNLSAPFILTRELAPAMAAAGGGAIVNIASRNAFRSSVGMAGYDASKAAMVALTRTAAGELARDNIRVNAVCPGVISTLGDDSTAEDRLFKSAYSKLIPMDRYGTPDEIAAVTLFLLSDEASFVTGQTLIADGGQIACQDNARMMEIIGLR